MAMLGRALRSGERRRRLLAGGLAPMPAPQVSGAGGRRARAGLPPPLSCLPPGPQGLGRGIWGAGGARGGSSRWWLLGRSGAARSWPGVVVEVGCVEGWGLWLAGLGQPQQVGESEENKSLLRLHSAQGVRKARVVARPEGTWFNPWGLFLIAATLRALEDVAAINAARCIPVPSTTHPRVASCSWESFVVRDGAETLLRNPSVGSHSLNLPLLR